MLLITETFSSLGVFLDLSKAFDTVSHRDLLDKLSHYNLSENTLRWLKTISKTANSMFVSME